MFDEFVWRQKNLIAWVCYDNINLAQSPAVQATAPVRPIRDMSCVTGHVPVEMNQLHSGHPFKSSFNIESSKLSALCAKTHWRGILLLPSICKVNRNFFLISIKHVCYSNKKTNRNSNIQGRRLPNIYSTQRSCESPMLIEGKVNSWTQFLVLANASQNYTWKRFNS